MRTETKSLLAQIACQIQGMWMHSYEPEFTAHCSAMFASYTANLLNGTTRMKGEALKNLASLRDDLTTALARHGRTVEFGRDRRWHLRLVASATLEVL